MILIEESIKKMSKSYGNHPSATAEDYQNEAWLKILEIEKRGFGKDIKDELQYNKYLITVAKTAMDEANDKFVNRLTCSHTTSYFIRGIQNNPHLSTEELSLKYKISPSRVDKLKDNYVCFDHSTDLRNIPSGTNRINIEHYINRSLLTTDQISVLDLFLEGNDLPNISVQLKKEPKEIKKIYLSLIEDIRIQNRRLLED